MIDPRSLGNVESLVYFERAAAAAAFPSVKKIPNPRWWWSASIIHHPICTHTRTQKIIIIIILASRILARWWIILPKFFRCPISTFLIFFENGKNPCGLPICLCSKNPNMSSLKKLLIPAHIFSLNSFCVAYFSGEISIRIWIGSLPELALERRIRSSSKAHCNSNNWNVAAAAAAATWWRNYLIKSRRREVIWRESSPYVSSLLCCVTAFRH